jgi:uncharacterized protein
MTVNEANVGSPRAVGPVTVVLSRRVKPGNEPAFESLLERIAAEATKFPGHEGVAILRPQPGNAPVYTIVLHFRTQAELDNWTGSAVRGQLLAEAELITDSGLAVQQATGLEAWFQVPGQPLVVPPPKYKMAVISWIVIFPVSAALSAGAAVVMRESPALGRSVVVSLLLIVLVTWVLMPLATRAFGFWLFPRTRFGSRQTDASGSQPKAGGGWHSRGSDSSFHSANSSVRSE